MNYVKCDKAKKTHLSVDKHYNVTYDLKAEKSSPFYAYVSKPTNKRGAFSLIFLYLFGFPLAYSYFEPIS